LTGAVLIGHGIVTFFYNCGENMDTAASQVEQEAVPIAGQTDAMGQDDYPRSSVRTAVGELLGFLAVALAAAGPLLAAALLALWLMEPR
jgi:hypothetical protein